MTVNINHREIMETIRMVQTENLDVRTITMGISLRDCADPSLEKAAKKVYDKICFRAEKLVFVGDAISRDFGIPIVNKRIAVTPSPFSPNPPSATIIPLSPWRWTGPPVRWGSILSAVFPLWCKKAPPSAMKS